MADAADPTLLVLAAERPAPAVEKALAAAADALGHAAGLAVRTLDAAGEGGSAGGGGGGRTFSEASCGAPGDVVPSAAAADSAAAGGSDPEALALCIEGIDPWAVVAIDEPAIEALRRAFGGESPPPLPDKPVEARGYTLVAVPGFAACLDDQQAKRVAWRRLKAARHPRNPLD